MKYSIIIPVYNASKYLRKCLDSLLTQSYGDDIEIIAINDGSTDNSLDILKEYKKKNKNIKVCSQDNKGVVVARELGLTKVSGTYCLMMDADDWLTRDAIKIIDNYLMKFEDVDVLKFRFVRWPSGRKEPVYEFSNKVLNKQELQKMRKDLIETYKYNNLSNQVFKTKLYDMVTGMHDERVDYGEDAMVNLDILGRAKRIVFVNDILYNYNRENQDSTTHSIDLKKLSKNISNIICLNKKRAKYSKLFHLDDVKIDDLKRKTVIFACTQIKSCISETKNIDSTELLNSLSNSGLYEYWDGNKISNINMSQKIICRCIRKRNFKILKWIRPCFVLETFLKRLYHKYWS